ncbi:BQ2448_6963 [Microbotryum intermedium]|uniref:BQ2448_6963 protein n=1 Tax=Microbotryum intermedium TaxID=269621 RepID=A0A238FPA2_9BASI|nr:BQ2448_6963 [Microbotryum intermedium]
MRDLSVNHTSLISNFQSSGHVLFQMPENPVDFDEMRRLRAFLDTAPAQLHGSRPLSTPLQVEGGLPTASPSRIMLRFKLPNQEEISCILWEENFYITSTDILRIIAYRLNLLGGPLRSWKKIEEGVFSDLRNLKEGRGSIMLESKSELVQLLFRHQCIRTQKKQKIFFWQGVPHEQLYRAAVSRQGLLPSVNHRQPKLSENSRNVSTVAHSTQEQSQHALRECGAKAEDLKKSFACPLASCDRRFNRLEHSLRHLRVHTQERPHICPQCFKSFARFDNLRAHVSSTVYGAMAV